MISHDTAYYHYEPRVFWGRTLRDSFSNDNSEEVIP
jgi:hypothetical protein